MTLPDWRGRTAYVVGGGPSLRGFDWSRLGGRLVIGCNHAYKLSEVGLVVFCDLPFFAEHREALAQCGKPVVTNHPALQNLHRSPDWLLGYARLKRGLTTEPYTLAYNASTGATAIHLAMKLGAARVYLMGIDMKPGDDGRNNWHVEGGLARAPAVYQRHLKGMRELAAALPSYYPDRQVIQLVLEGDGLGVFPVELMDRHLEQQEVAVG